MDVVCANCKWFRDLTQGETGKCVRYPPRVFPHGDGTRSLWPAVQTKQSCGEWAPASIKVNEIEAPMAVVQ